MKIRGYALGTPLKPERVLVKATNLSEEEKAQARANIGAAAVGEGGGGSGGSGGSITVDSALDPNSTNPVQNKVVYATVQQATEAIQRISAAVPTDTHINELIDTYLSEALGGDY